MELTPQLNRDINQLFYQLSEQIYHNDKGFDDTLGWWPIRPVFVDGACAEFVFKEMIRLFRKAEGKLSDQEVADCFKSQITIKEYQYLWPALHFSKSGISFEDKIYLISKLFDLSKLLSAQSDVFIFGELGDVAWEAQDDSFDLMIQEGSKLYFKYLSPLYSALGEDVGSVVKKFMPEILEKAKTVKNPAAWGDESMDKVIRRLVRNFDFRRELTKTQEAIVTGMPEVPGMAIGTVGQDIQVAFTIETVDDQINSYVTDIDSFKNVDRNQFIKAGIPVISRTRNGSHKLKPGQKIIVDGTSGIVYSINT